MNFKVFKNMLPAAALLLSLGMSSCVGDLDVDPIDPSTRMNVDAASVYNKCFANMGVAGNGGANGDCDIDGLDGGTTGFVRQLWNANELTTDEAICGWGDEGIPAFDYNQWGASHPMLKGFYYRLYFGVSACNQYLAEFADYDAQMTAEIRFLRALYYYYLMDGWGNVPFTETVLLTENAKQISRADLFKWIEQELTVAESGMAEPAVKRSTDAGYGRPDKAAAWMLFARLYLNAEVYTGEAQWQKAADYAKKVMDSPYSIFNAGNDEWSAYRMLFMGDNGENGASVEAILPILQDGKTTTSWGTTLFLTASTFKEDMTIKGDATNGTTEKWAGNRARPELVAKFFPNNNAPLGTTDELVAAARDDRALLWGKDRTLSVDKVGEFTSGFSVSKFINLYSDGGNSHSSQFTDADFFLMRTAEANLTYAEATARLNGGSTTPEGASAINELRTRAHAVGHDTYTLNQILDEWSREFYFEGRRRVDLIRFGYYGGDNDYSWQWKGGSKENGKFSADMNIFAIPETDLNANSNLKQNPGY